MEFLPWAEDGRDRQPDICFEESNDLKFWDVILDPVAEMESVSDSHSRWTLIYDIASTESNWFLREAAAE